MTGAQRAALLQVRRRSAVELFFSVILVRSPGKPLEGRDTVAAWRTHAGNIE